jgi:hypothetical protein
MIDLPRDDGVRADRRTTKAATNAISVVFEIGGRSIVEVLIHAHD